MSNRLSVARHHLHTGNPRRALELIAELDASELQGAESEAYEIAADSHLRLGDHEQARDAARRSLELEPTNLDALRTLAWSSAGLGDHLTVSSTMTRALEIDPTNVVLLVDNSNLLINQGRLSESTEFLTRASEIAPDDLLVKSGQMEHAHASRDYRRAQTLAREILAQRPDHVRALAMDAIAAERAGDIRTTASRMRRLASLKLGDHEAAAGAREATAWSHPRLRPAWWLLQRWWGRWLGLSAAFAVFRMTVTWYEEGKLPYPPVYVALVVVVAYLGFCLAWVDEKKSGPARKWVPRDE